VAGRVLGFRRSERPHRFQWDRRRAALPNRPRKQIALNRVLVACPDLFHSPLDRRRSLRASIRSRIRSPRNRIKLNFDFDAARGSYELEALIGNRLGAAADDTVPARELQNRRRQHIRAESPVLKEDRLISLSEDL
jgi:hypothetical protein